MIRQEFELMSSSIRVSTELRNRLERIRLDLNQPAYDILHRIFLKLEKLQEEQQEAREFLEMAIEDKKQFRIENEELRDRVKSLEIALEDLNL